MRNMKTWIISDSHFNHQMLIDKGLRPKDFESKILKSLSQLTSNDILIHLGDICIGNDNHTHSIIKHLNCKKILVKGNHDRKSNSWYLNNGWDFVCREFVDKYFRINILFSHIAKIHRDNIDINIHGHSHGNAHRDEEYCNFYDEKYHKEIALEKTNYKLINLETFIKKL